jgi:hypothetical protein
MIVAARRGEGEEKEVDEDARRQVTKWECYKSGKIIFQPSSTKV